MAVFVFTLVILSTASTLVAGKHSDVTNREQSRRLRRNALPIIYDIYSLDHFVAIVEKIEIGLKADAPSLQTIVNYVRKNSENYDDTLWNILLGAADPLPDGVLNSEEKRVLKVMTSHRYLNGGTHELGVVRTHEGETIAVGNVIVGISAGLKRNTRLSLRKWSPKAKENVDNLLTAVLGFDLSLSGLATKNNDQNKWFGPPGTWGTAQCPAEYNRGGFDEETQATDAEILGGVDGFILGSAVSSWESEGVRLSQILRMYYGAGVVYDTSYRSCNRKAKFDDLTHQEAISDGIEAFASAYYLKNAASYPRVTEGDIRGISIDVAEAFTPYYEKLLNNQICTPADEEDCELPANVVFILDESGSIKAPNYVKSKQFIKNVINAFDISVRQARVALVEFSSGARLKIALDDYGAKTPLLCAIDGLQYKTGSTHTADAIRVVNDYILGPAQQQAQSTDTVQIVILLTDGHSNDRDPNALKREVTRIKKQIRGLTMLAVGVANYNLAELRMIATKRYRHVFTVETFDKLVDLVKTLRRAACYSPAHLALDFTQTGNETAVVAYVSPGNPRFFTLPASLFFGVSDIYVEVTPVYGTVSVYASRVTPNPGPNNHSFEIGPKEPGVPSTIHFGGLCESYNVSTCPPVYIGIYGERSELSCSDLDCNLPNQIKFTIKRGRPPSNGGRNQRGNVGATVALPVLTLLFFFMRNKFGST